MKAEFTGRFYKDIDKITHSTVKAGIIAIIKQVEEANKLSEIKTLKSLFWVNLQIMLLFNIHMISFKIF